MITVFVIWKNASENLADTIRSFGNWNESEQIYIKVLCHNDCLKKVQDTDKEPYENVQWVAVEEAGMHAEQDRYILECLQEELQKTATSYVSFIRAGEAFRNDALKGLCNALKNREAETDCAAPLILRKKEKELAVNKETLLDLTKKEEVLLSPGCLEGLVFRTDALQGEQFDFSYGAGVIEEFKYRILLKKSRLVFVPQAQFSTTTEFLVDNGYRAEWKNPDWYLSTAEEFCLRILENYRNSEGVIPFLIQSQVLHILNTQFFENLNSRNKNALNEQHREAYFESCKGCLKQIDTDFLLNREEKHRDRGVSGYCRSMFVRLKFEHADEQCEAAKEFFPVKINLIETEDNKWKLDGMAEPFLLEGSRKFCICLNGKELSYIRNQRYSGIKFFGKNFVKATFRIEIPIDELVNKNVLEFCLKDENGKEVLLLASSKYQSRISSAVKGSYWCFGPYMTLFRVKNKKKNGIIIRKAGNAARILQELKVLAQMPFGKNRSRRMFVMRLRYWMAYPQYHKKNIWLTFDKLYKGGDCGEYFYKYMVSRTDTDVVPAYVINSNAPDKKRLQKEGYKTLSYGSLEQKLHYLYATMVFGTHSGVHSFNGFSTWEMRYLQDRLRAVNTCIQHGLSVQDLSFDSNRIVNNNKRYYCASRYEVENLSKPSYDYGPDVLRLTGIPRYDGLVNQDKRQILITPTWRSYIAMPAVMGESRPYNPEFRNTDYYRIFQALLENKKLSQTAEKTGYKVIYLLHPVISSQKNDFHTENGIEIVSAVDVNYEKILTESSLMVTDYSGVQFDFAYMRKPVVYFHPPKLPPHYEEGGFFYDTQGFGEICTESEELVDMLCEYMENGCQLKEFYRGRQDDFFAFEDLNNCQRIYEDALQYQKEHQNEI